MISVEQVCVVSSVVAAQRHVNGPQVSSAGNTSKDKEAGCHLIWTQSFFISAVILVMYRFSTYLCQCMFAHSSMWRAVSTWGCTEWLESCDTLKLMHSDM